MTAAATLSKLQAAGIELTPGIQFKTPKTGFPEDLRAAAREHKPEILRILILGEDHGAGPPRPSRRSDLKGMANICADSRGTLWTPGRLVAGENGCLWVDGEAVPDAAEKLLSMLAPHWPGEIVGPLRKRWLARLKAMSPEAAFLKLYADALDVTTPSGEAS